MNILPLPALLEQYPGTFTLNAHTGLHTDEANAANAGFLRNLLAVPSGFPFPSTDRQTNTIHLRLDPAGVSLGDEGYRLEVRSELIEISAGSPAGVFWGIQTLRQLLPPGIETRRPLQADWQVPCVHIEDQPRFAWRGFMLDEGRYFHGMETVLQALDLMALLKLNVFHWHLTEDQGWRIEISRYPRLTEVGAHRPGTSLSMLQRGHDGIPHSGFYTQAQIRQVVAYAAARHITIVPEIEMPGHSLAALAAYPEFSCRGGPFEPATHFGIFPDIYCAGKEGTFQFLQDVLDEVLALFPSPIIHIGGDEAPKARWKHCPDCQARMRSEGLADEHSLQVWFTNRILQYLQGKGRRLLGWNQILEKSLDPSAIIQFWSGDRKALIEALRSGRQAVLSDYLDTYLDHSHALTPLSRAYTYEPIPIELDASASANVLGLEFPLWTEWVPDRARLHYQAMPRLAAAAETGWTPQGKKDLAGFLLRMAGFSARLDALGIRQAPMQAAQPSWLAQRLGIFTIVMPQRKRPD